MSDDKQQSAATAIGIENGKVVIYWPELDDSPVLVYDPDSADQFADTVKQKAQRCRELTKQ